MSGGGVSLYTPDAPDAPDALDTLDALELLKQRQRWQHISTPARAAPLANVKGFLYYICKCVDFRKKVKKIFGMSNIMTNFALGFENEPTQRRFS